MEAAAQVETTTKADAKIVSQTNREILQEWKLFWLLAFILTYIFSALLTKKSAFYY